MRIVTIALILSITALPAYSQILDDSQRHEILSCIEQKGSAHGASLPRFDKRTVLYRYHVGQFSFHLPDGRSVSADRNDELRVAVYGPDEASVVIYDVFLEQREGKTEVTLGYPARFSKRSGRWIGHDNPGGIATDSYLKELLSDLSLKAALKLPLGELTINPQSDSCAAGGPDLTGPK